jgi:hypothetical protein
VEAAAVEVLEQLSVLVVKVMVLVEVLVVMDQLQMVVVVLGQVEHQVVEQVEI